MCYNQVVLTAHFRFYAELNDFLPQDRRQVIWERYFEVRGSVKDMIEAIGVPHTEVDLILANGESVDFDYLVENGDYVSVYPVFESVDITPLLRVRPRPLRVARFVLDVHLGRLATYLRMIGFDALYSAGYCDEELAHISVEERRILLTRDRGLLKRGQVTHGYWVRATEPRRQLVEVLRRFDLFGQTAPFRRCLRCNSLLEPVRKEEIVGRLPSKTRQCYDEFAQCRTCDRVYWKGSHYERMQRFIEQVLAEN
jgi:uncharacterized protein with PIN domain